MQKIDWHQIAKSGKATASHFIDGQLEPAEGKKMIEKYAPHNGKLLYAFGDSLEEDYARLNRAVANARDAFSDGRWSSQTANQRKIILHKLADLLEQHKQEFALNECLDVGKPIHNALEGDVPRSVATLRAAADNAGNLLSQSGADGANFSFQLRKPIGVVGGIIGWNFPLRLATSKVGPALAMGNSLVLKPSEFTALSASRLAELAIEAGVPKGVFNVVQGRGSTLGEAMALHPDIDLLSFVGSSHTGKRLMEYSGQSNMKRLILECGGKSPFIVFDDCPEDLDAIAATVVALAFPNQGAVCVAGTRLLVQDSIKEPLLAKVIEHAAKLVPSDPLNPQARFGALINQSHMQKVLEYIGSGQKEGARLLHGGHQVMQDTGGYYVGPTIFDKVEPQHRIAQEEIFGPVLSVMSFKDETEAIALANSTCYGLAAYAATQNLARAQRLARQLSAGFISVLGTSTPSAGGVSLGIEGHRQSGFGYEGGLDGLAAYTLCSTVNLMT